MPNFQRFQKEQVMLLVDTTTGELAATQGMIASMCRQESTNIKSFLKNRGFKESTQTLKDSRGVNQLSKVYDEKAILEVFAKYKPELLILFISMVKELTGKELPIPPIPTNKPKYNRKPTGYIYLFGSEHLLKLGFSSNPKKRIKQLERWNGELEILHTIKGVEVEERQLHNLLHQTGEYFGWEWYPVYRKHEILNLMGYITVEQKKY